MKMWILKLVANLMMIILWMIALKSLLFFILLWKSLDIYKKNSNNKEEVLSYIGDLLKKNEFVVLI